MVLRIPLLGVYCPNVFSTTTLLDPFLNLVVLTSVEYLLYVGIGLGVAITTQSWHV